MFIPLKFVIPNKIKKMGIEKNVKIVSVCSNAEKIINKKMDIDVSALGIKGKVLSVLSCKNKELSVSATNSYILGEMKLMESDIVLELRKNKLDIDRIKFIS